MWRPCWKPRRGCCACSRSCRPGDGLGRDLADRLGVSDRTVRRDVERLRDLGYPVHASRGTDGGYRLGAGTAMPPCSWTTRRPSPSRSACAPPRRLGRRHRGDLRTRAHQTGTGAPESRLRHRVDALRASTEPVPADRPGPTVDAAVLSTLATACRNRERLRFDYRAHDGSSTLRVVEPLPDRVVGPPLVPRRLGRRPRRLAHLPRRPHSPRAPRPARASHPATRPKEARPPMWRGECSAAAWRHRARVVVHAPADLVTERINPAVGVVEAIDEKTCVLDTGADTVQSLAVHPGPARPRLRRVRTAGTDRPPAHAGHPLHARDAAASRGEGGPTAVAPDATAERDRPEHAAGQGQERQRQQPGGDDPVVDAEPALQTSVGNTRPSTVTRASGTSRRTGIGRRAARRRAAQRRASDDRGDAQQHGHPGPARPSRIAFTTVSGLLMGDAGAPVRPTRRLAESRAGSPTPLVRTRAATPVPGRRPCPRSRSPGFRRGRSSRRADCQPRAWSPAFELDGVQLGQGARTQQIRTEVSLVEPQPPHHVVQRGDHPAVAGRIPRHLRHREGDPENDLVAGRRSPSARSEHPRVEPVAVMPSGLNSSAWRKASKDVPDSTSTILAAIE